MVQQSDPSPNGGGWAASDDSSMTIPGLVNFALPGGPGTRPDACSYPTVVCQVTMGDMALGDAVPGKTALPAQFQVTIVVMMAHVGKTPVPNPQV